MMCPICFLLGKVVRGGQIVDCPVCDSFGYLPPLYEELQTWKRQQRRKAK